MVDVELSAVRRALCARRRWYGVPSSRLAITAAWFCRRWAPLNMVRRPGVLRRCAAGLRRGEQQVGPLPAEPDSGWREPGAALGWNIPPALLFYLYP